MNTFAKSLKIVAMFIALFVVLYLSEVLAWLTLPLLKIGAVLSVLWVLVDMFS